MPALLLDMFPLLAFAALLVFVVLREVGWQGATSAERTALVLGIGCLAAALFLMWVIPTPFWSLYFWIGFLSLMLLALLLKKRPTFWRDSSPTERATILLAFSSLVGALVTIWVFPNPTLYQVFIVAFVGLLILVRVLRGRRQSRASEDSTRS